MPIVDNEIKLDFKDVLIRPKRSTIKSRADVSSILTFFQSAMTQMTYSCFCYNLRSSILPRGLAHCKWLHILSSISIVSSQVDLARKFVFRHAKKSFPEDAIPVIAANMDTVGTFEMATVLAKVCNIGGNYPFCHYQGCRRDS